MEHLPGEFAGEERGTTAGRLPALEPALHTTPAAHPSSHYCFRAPSGRVAALGCTKLPCPLTTSSKDVELPFGRRTTRCPQGVTRALAARGARRPQSFAGVRLGASRQTCNPNRGPLVPVGCAEHPTGDWVPRDGAIERRSITNSEKGLGGHK
jgi:hypothetical protein